MKDPINYNASTGGSGNYTHFIEEVRTEISKLDDIRFVHNRPVLPKMKKPIQYFHIILHGNNNHILRLKFQIYDLYLVAFETDGSTNSRGNKTWFWFDDFYVSGVDDHESLNINGSHVNEDKLGDVELGRKPLLDAISYLATYNKKKGGAKLHLEVLIIMISEAIRFNELSHNVIAKLLHDTVKDKKTKLGDELETFKFKIFQKWDDVCEDVLKCHADKQHKFPKDTYSSFGIKTFEDAISKLSVLKFVEKD